jgi:hypothetical protein
MKIQDVIDYEQNKIRNTAKSLNDIELVRFILLYDGNKLYQCQVNRLTREELIDMYCEIVFDRSHL